MPVTRDGFAASFVNTILTIKAAIAARLHYQGIYPLGHDLPQAGPPVTTLSLPSVDKVIKLIKSMPAKSSPIDAIPT